MKWRIIVLAGFLKASEMAQSVFSPPYAKLLERLIELRKRSNVTQAELAARLKKPQQFVSRYELGIRRIDVVEFYAIAMALELDPAHEFSALVAEFPRTVSI